MKKLLIGKRDQRIALLKEQTKVALPSLRKVHESFKSLNIGEFLLSDLDFVHNKEEFIRNKIMQQSDKHEVSGIAINRDDLRRMVELPENTGPFYQAVDEFLGIKAQCFSRHGLSIDFYKIEQECIEIDESKMSEFEEKNTLFACHEREVELYEALKVLCEALNKSMPILSKYQGTHERYGEHEGIVYRPIDRTYTPNPEFIKHRCEPHIKKHVA